MEVIWHRHILNANNSHASSICSDKIFFVQDNIEIVQDNIEIVQDNIEIIQDKNFAQG